MMNLNEGSRKKIRELCNETFWIICTSLVHYKKSLIPHAIYFIKMCTSLSCPLMNLIEISTSVKGFCMQYYFIANTYPFHWCEVGMALDCLAKVIEAMIFGVISQNA